MAHTFTSLHTHLIFSTKSRKPFLRPEFKSRLFDYMGGIIRNMDGQSFLINGPEDHVHVLAGLPSTRSLADFLRDLKGDSSRWAKDSLNMPDFGWQTGYAAFSVSKSNTQTVYGYIAKQEEHHRNVSFRDEYLEFLRRHEIEFDERFVFD
jgi:putative transposase